MATTNAVKMLIRIEEHLDRVKTTRNSDRVYMNAINEAIELIMKDRIEPIRIPRRYSVQSAQRIRDELYTLIPAPATGTPSSSTVPYPNNYYYLLLLYQTINGTQYYCRPTTYNELGPLVENPFTRPSATKPYFNEFVTGFKIHYGGTGTLGTYELHYIKTPDVVTIGKETDKIVGTATPGQLTSTATYYVYEDAVHAGVTYYPGDSFVASSTTLTSGTVIPATVVTNCNLPGNMHEEVIKMAASIISGNVEDYNKKQSLENDVEKS